MLQFFLENRKFKWLIFISFLLCSGCGGRLGVGVGVGVPIVSGWHSGVGSSKPNNYYVVQPKDTLYSVAWAFDMDFRELARINHLSSPYTIKRGQKLIMTKESGKGYVPTATAFNKKHVVPVITGSAMQVATTHHSRHHRVVHHSHPLPATTKMSHRWLWPVHGKVVKYFSKVQSKENKGVDIGAPFASAVNASNSGKVVYCGVGMRTYGNLLIIKHSDNFLSAYAYNKTMLVKEGDVVKAGQKIALVGRNNLGKSVLHFEIRRNGRPVNPLRYLKK